MCTAGTPADIPEDIVSNDIPDLEEEEEEEEEEERLTVAQQDSQVRVQQ